MQGSPIESRSQENFKTAWTLKAPPNHTQIHNETQEALLAQIIWAQSDKQLTKDEAKQKQGKTARKPGLKIKTVKKKKVKDISGHTVRVKI